MINVFYIYCKFIDSFLAWKETKPLRRFNKPTFAFSIFTAAIYAIAGGTIWNIIQDQISRGVSEWQAWTLAFVILSFAIICFMIHYVVIQVDDLHKKNRISIRYYASDDPNGPERVYDESRKFIEEAKEDGTSQIIAVNSFVEIFQESDDSVAEKHRNAYFHAIENKVGKVDYHRIIQLNLSDPDVNQISKRIANNYKEHFATIIKKRDSNKFQRGIRLDRVNARYPITFVVIENKNDTSYLIWQINEHISLLNGVSDALRLKGVFLIVDPDQQIIKYFKSWFNQISNNETLQPIKLSELI